MRIKVARDRARAIHVGLTNEMSENQLHDFRFIWDCLFPRENFVIYRIVLRMPPLKRFPMTYTPTGNSELSTSEAVL